MGKFKDLPLWAKSLIATGIIAVVIGCVVLVVNTGKSGKDKEESLAVKVIDSDEVPLGFYTDDENLGTDDALVESDNENIDDDSNIKNEEGLLLPIAEKDSKGDIVSLDDATSKDGTIAQSNGATTQNDTVAQNNAVTLQDGTIAQNNDATTQNGTIAQNNSVTSQNNAGIQNNNTTSQNGNTNQQPVEVVDKYAGYQLVWADEFNGNEINTADWNYECHDPGWVNNELQAYTNSTDNIYVEDGHLVIKAIKSEVNGVASYTSGKVTTQNLHDFKYGRFEISAKAVEGQGLWPAIWMMPTNENYYGQWPKCGEIDIMEILGHEPNKTYATIHFGNPHKEVQGYYIAEESLANDYHVYAVEWEPGLLKFYIDDVLVNEVNDWFTATEGQGEATFPAPFDQDFYLQLNLAVGGTWPGNPDSSTNFDNAEFMIDYVRVYQKDSYDENVTKPEKPAVVLRNPDESGNYIVNGDFADISDDLTDDVNWGVKYALGGIGSVVLANNQMIITSENAGTVDYSIQIVQPFLPMAKGGEYTLTFDAYADAARTMIVDITGPDNSYVRYMKDTQVALTTEKQSYSYTFTMTGNDDANGRLEFNLGNQGSTETVYIENVKLVKNSQTEIVEEKTVRADGNFVYNGGFEEGTGRLGFWTTNVNDGSSISVTNINGIRELNANVVAGSSLADVTISQELAIVSEKTYQLSFDAYADSEKTIKVMIDGNEFEAALNTSNNKFEFSFVTGAYVFDKKLVFLLGNEGATYIDNVRVCEAGLLINGDFVNNFVGWSPFVDGGISSSVSYTVDSLNNASAAAFEIRNTGDADWKIQLIQDGIDIENGKWYKLTFDAKTDMVGGREISYAIQKNGSADNDWTPYSGSQIVTLGDSYQTYEVTFMMNSETDLNARLSFNLGAVNGTQITTRHNVYIDNVTLEEVAAIAPETPENQSLNMINNAGFTDGDGFANWEKVICAGGEATFTPVENGVQVAITNVGTQDYAVQLKEMIEGLVNGHTYQLTMNINSSVVRTMKLGLMTTDYDWYGGADISLAENNNTVDITFTVDKATINETVFAISLGKIAGEETPAGIITITSISLKDITEDENNTNPVIFSNGDFSNGLNGWNYFSADAGAADFSVTDGICVVDITDVGTADWNVQMIKGLENLKAGQKYRLSYSVESSSARTILFNVMSSTYSWYGGDTTVLDADVPRSIITDFYLPEDAAIDAISLYISMGAIDNTETPAGTVKISNISVTEVNE